MLHPVVPYFSPKLRHATVVYGTPVRRVVVQLESLELLIIFSIPLSEAGSNSESEQGNVDCEVDVLMLLASVTLVLNILSLILPILATKKFPKRLK